MQSGQPSRSKSKQNNKQNPKLDKKVVPANVEDAKPLKKTVQQLGIAELSRKIDELNMLLQGDMEEANLDLDNTIQSLKNRKKSLVQKIKPQRVAPPKARSMDNVLASPKANTMDNVVASEETVDTVVPPKVKPGKTKVENPLTKSIPKKSKAKKIKKPEVEERVVVEEADNEDTVDSDEIDDNNAEIDDNNPDYPDDPTFRGRIEI